MCVFRPPSGSDVAYTDPNDVRAQLGSWDNRHYDFHYNSEPSTRRLKSYQACQQDAVLFTGHGLFGGCDGSADRKHERMGAGAVLTEGSTLDPILQISIPVGFGSPRSSGIALPLTTNPRENGCTRAIDSIYRLLVPAPIPVQMGERELLAWT